MLRTSSQTSSRHSYQPQADKIGIRNAELHKTFDKKATIDSAEFFGQLIILQKYILIIKTVRIQKFVYSVIIPNSEFLIPNLKTRLKRYEIRYSRLAQCRQEYTF